MEKYIIIIDVNNIQKSEKSHIYATSFINNIIVVFNHMFIILPNYK